MWVSDSKNSCVSLCPGLRAVFKQGRGFAKLSFTTEGGLINIPGKEVRLLS